MGEPLPWQVLSELGACSVRFVRNHAAELSTLGSGMLPWACVDYALDNCGLDKSEMGVQIAGSTDKVVTSLRRSEVSTFFGVSEATINTSFRDLSRVLGPSHYIHT